MASYTPQVRGYCWPTVPRPDPEQNRQRDRRTTTGLSQLLSDPLAAETGFYNQYRWCLDACPVLGEV